MLRPQPQVAYIPSCTIRWQNRRILSSHIPLSGDTATRSADIYEAAARPGEQHDASHRQGETTAAAEGIGAQREHTAHGLFMSHRRQALMSNRAPPFPRLIQPCRTAGRSVLSVRRPLSPVTGNRRSSRIQGGAALRKARMPKPPRVQLGSADQEENASQERNSFPSIQHDARGVPASDSFSFFYTRSTTLRDPRYFPAKTAGLYISKLNARA